MSAMTVLVGRRAMLDYVRRPLNLVLLVAVPVVLVFVWGGTLADFSKLLGGSGNQGQIEAATAGWAAAALAGLAGFFQVTGSRSTDRRLAAAGQRTAPVVAGRLGAAFGLALLAAAGGLVALAARAGITDPPRAVTATVLIAVIYLALGVLVGTVVRTEMNGALVVTLAWVFDVFFGPALGPGSSAATLGARSLDPRRDSPGCYDPSRPRPRRPARARAGRPSNGAGDGADESATPGPRSADVAPCPRPVGDGDRPAAIAAKQFPGCGARDRVASSGTT